MIFLPVFLPVHPDQISIDKQRLEEKKTRTTEKSRKWKARAKHRMKNLVYSCVYIMHMLVQFYVHLVHVHARLEDLNQSSTNTGSTFFLSFYSFTNNPFSYIYHVFSDREYIYIYLILSTVAMTKQEQNTDARARTNYKNACSGMNLISHGE